MISKKITELPVNENDVKFSLPMLYFIALTQVIKIYWINYYSFCTLYCYSLQIQTNVFMVICKFQSIITKAEIHYKYLPLKNINIMKIFNLHINCNHFNFIILIIFILITSKINENSPQYNQNYYIIILFIKLYNDSSTHLNDNIIKIYCIHIIIKQRI